MSHAYSMHHDALAASNTASAASVKNCRSKCSCSWDDDRISEIITWDTSIMLGQISAKLRFAIRIEVFFLLSSRASFLCFSSSCPNRVLANSFLGYRKPWRHFAHHHCVVKPPGDILEADKAVEEMTPHGVSASIGLVALLANLRSQQN